MSHHYEGPKDRTNPLYYVPVAIIAIAVVASVFVSGFKRGSFSGQMTEKVPVAAGGDEQVDVRALAHPTEELVTKGRQVFTVNCVSCHGAEGRGDGPKGADLNPLPRNFHAPASDWTNGPSITAMWTTLDKGVPGTSMSAYTLLPGDERIALIHYIRETFVQDPPEITPEDVAALPGPSGAASSGAALAAPSEPTGPTIPIELAMARIAQAHDVRPVNVSISADIQSLPGSNLYGIHCASCHGDTGGGSTGGRVLTVHPFVRLSVGPFSQMPGEWQDSREEFARVVTTTSPGRAVHGFAALTGEELDDLHEYVTALGREGVIAE